MIVTVAGLGLLSRVLAIAGERSEHGTPDDDVVLYRRHVPAVKA